MKEIILPLLLDFGEDETSFLVCKELPLSIFLGRRISGFVSESFYLSYWLYISSLASVSSYWHPTSLQEWIRRRNQDCTQMEYCDLLQMREQSRETCNPIKDVFYTQLHSRQNYLLTCFWGFPPLTRVEKVAGLRFLALTHLKSLQEKVGSVLRKLHTVWTNTL